MVKKQTTKKQQEKSPTKDQRNRTFQVTDKRFWVSDESAIGEARPPERKFPSFIEELKARTELAETRLKEKLESLDRDNDALRNRLRRDMEQRLEREKLSLVNTFLEVADNFERALEATVDSDNFPALREGVEMNLRLFLQKLELLGLESIEPVGEEFDPEVAEAVAMVPVQDSAQDQKVVLVVQRGYRRGEHLLRPAQVHVGRFEG